MPAVPFRRRRTSIASILADLAHDSAVQIAGRDGSVSQATPGCTFLDPTTGTAISANRSYNLVGPGGLVLPAYTAFPVATNLFLNSQAPATQNCAVVTGSVTVTAIGTGYTVTTSAGTATGSGFGLVTNGTAQVLTITGNGTITLTIAGTPANACVQVQSGALRTPLIVTAGSTVTRAADANIWTMADVLTQDEELCVLVAQLYADGDMGIASQTWLESVTPTYPRMLRGTTNRLDSSDYNAAPASVVDTIATSIPTRSKTFILRHKRRATDVEAGFNTALSGSPTAVGTAPWTDQDVVRIGTGATAGREPYALVGCIRRKDGFSQAQIDALYYGFANGRTVPVVA
jgi:hypothetical protein